MKLLITMLLFTASGVFASDVDLRQIYLDFESAYMSNDAGRISEWLAENYEIKQTLHIPGVGPDYRPVSKEQLIASMNRTGKPSSFPRSERDSVIIIENEQHKFCGTSKTLNKTIVRGKDFEEKEERRVCFDYRDGRYFAVEHTIDVFFTEM